MLRLLPALAAALLLLGCSGPSTGGVPVIGPPNPQDIALKPGDVPSVLKACEGSGPIAGYIAALRTKDPDGYAGLQDAWASLQKNGADAAAITAYVDDPATACTGTLGAGQGKSATSFVIRYKDEGSATTAYKRGLLNFPTPQQDQQTPGLTVGVATGLGANSWVYNRAVNGRAAYLAFWQSKQFDVMVLTADLDPGDSQKAADAVYSRAR
ncbi:MAG TPA: hypothetical protein VF160_15610 [Candidatus Dormibacteraeota bacterium]